MNESPVSHVLVVGFHHKRGAIVEYAYPPMGTGGASAAHCHTGDGSTVGECDLPPAWRHLPSLALPDGAHHLDKDTVYFVMPSADDRRGRAVFGISCYRQIASNDLVRRPSDVTRSTVQKAVCVISNVPAYAQIRAKLDLITHAYFNERDFSKVEVLAQMYRSLCAAFPSVDALLEEATFGISCRSFVRAFQRKALILFKLLLLEKRVLFYIFPVQRLCDYLVALLSLFPNMLEWGLYEGASYKPGQAAKAVDSSIVDDKSAPSADDVLMHEVDAALSHGAPESAADGSAKSVGAMAMSHSGSDDTMAQGAAGGSAVYGKVSAVGASIKALWGTGQTQASPSRSQFYVSGAATELAQDAGNVAHLADPQTDSYTTLKTDAWGFPLSIFVKGNLCQPYASLALMDDLRSANTRAYLLGATNALYRQRTELFDVIVQLNEEDEPEIDILDAELRRQLALSTADLRFVDYLMKNVGASDTGDVFLDNTSWEGGDEWLRLQFRSYLLSLMASASYQPSSALDAAADAQSQTANPYVGDFNESFVCAWKERHNYRVWSTGHYPDLCNAIVGHPFSGQFSPADLRLRLESALTSSAPARRRIQAAVSGTGARVRNLVGTLWGAVQREVVEGDVPVQGEQPQ